MTEDQILRAALVQRRETVVEINYNFKIAKWLHVMPGFQYIIDPDADSRRGNVSVIALKTQLNL